MQPILNFFSLHSIHGVQHVALILLAVGLVGCLRAIWKAGSTDTHVVNRAQAWGSLCAGVLTGAGVTLGVLVLQQWLTDANANAVWRANVQTAASIPGFTPAGHPLHGLVLSGKDLHDADLRGARLQGLQMEDTNLVGAKLEGARLQRADLIGAKLQTAELGHANLSGAYLQDARFDFASVENVRSFAGAQANAGTCWPAGFLELPVAREIKAEPYDNGQGGKITIPGHEYPHCLKPR